MDWTLNVCLLFKITCSQQSINEDTINNSMLFYGFAIKNTVQIFLAYLKSSMKYEDNVAEDKS